MTRRLHIGCGQNLLPDPWENLDSEIDIRKPLPFLIGSARFILAEHIIEHVTFREGLAFLQECLRVLEPGGVLRLAFPDITREIPVAGYRDGFISHYNRQINCPEDVWFSILTDWEHQSCWTKDMAVRVLLSVGFDTVTVRRPGHSFYGALQYACDVVPRFETTALEAVR